MPVSVVESEENSVVANVRVKRAGTRTQPCLMPLETGKGPHTNLFFHYASHHSNKERPDDVDKSRWTAKLEELWLTDPHD